jgi:hypothetical protein
LTSCRPVSFSRRTPIRANTNPPSPWAKSDTEKTNLFTRHLTELYEPHDDTPDPETIRKLANHAPSTEKLRAFTMGELKVVVKHLHPRKAPGPDLVTTIMIRELPQEGLKAILHLLNAITRLGYWPRPLKCAKVIMILKPGKDPTDVTSYRPISLLPVISKILEKLISRLNKDLPPPDMDSIAPIRISERALYNSSMPPAHRHHTQSLRRLEILPSSLSKCKPSF